VGAVPVRDNIKIIILIGKIKRGPLRARSRFRYDVDSLNFRALDKFLVIAVPDTFGQLNSMPNLFMLGNRGDSEGMAS
jgi:hypothetical protein